MQGQPRRCKDSQQRIGSKKTIKGPEMYNYESLWKRGMKDVLDGTSTSPVTCPQGSAYRRETMLAPLATEGPDCLSDLFLGCPPTSSPDDRMFARSDALAHYCRMSRFNLSHVIRSIVILPSSWNNRNTAAGQDTIQPHSAPLTVPMPTT